MQELRSTGVQTYVFIVEELLFTDKTYVCTPVLLNSCTPKNYYMPT